MAATRVDNAVAGAAASAKMEHTTSAPGAERTFKCDRDDSDDDEIDNDENGDDEIIDAESALDVDDDDKDDNEGAMNRTRRKTRRPRRCCSTPPLRNNTTMHVGVVATDVTNASADSAATRQASPRRADAGVTPSFKRSPMTKRSPLRVTQHTRVAVAATLVTQ
jgi:hypothetical protein